MTPPSADAAPLRIGVSACLLGREVRWDGHHKQNDFLTEVMARIAPEPGSIVTTSFAH